MLDSPERTLWPITSLDILQGSVSYNHTHRIYSNFPILCWASFVRIWIWFVVLLWFSYFLLFSSTAPPPCVSSSDLLVCVPSSATTFGTSQVFSDSP